MKKGCLVLVLTALLVTAAFAASESGKENGNQAKSDGDLISGLKNAITELKAVPFNLLITDAAIKAAIESIVKPKIGASRDANVSARHAIFDERLAPAFQGHPADYYGSLYSAYSAFNSKLYADDAKFPVEGGSILQNFRKVLMEKAREHLKNPENLLALLRMKKTFVLVEYSRMTLGEKKNFRDWLDSAVVAIEVFLKADFQFAYGEYRKANSVWTSAYKLEEHSGDTEGRLLEELLEKLPQDSEFRKKIAPGPLAKGNAEVPKGQKKLYEDYLTAKKEHALLSEKRRIFYEVMLEREGALKKLTPDLYLSLFIGRRHAEGGDAIVATWLEATKELRGQIGG